MLNLIQADLFKMRKSTALRILFGITALCAAVMAVMAYLIPKGQIAQSYTGMGFLISDIDVMSILGPALAGIFICGDFDNKTIHDSIAGGSSRTAVIVSKTVSFSLAAAFILLPYAIVTGIALSTGSTFNMGSVSVAFLNILSKESGSAFGAPELFKFLAAALTLGIVYISQLSLCVPLSFVFKKPVLVVVVYYAATLFFAQLVNLQNSSPVLKNVFSCTPYGGNNTFVTMTTGAGEILKTITVSLVFLILMLALTYGIFKKAEIK